MNRRRGSMIGTAAFVALGVALHFWLLHQLAEKNIVAVILSAGAHSPRSALLVAGAFLVIRILVVLLLPGAILCRCVLWAWAGRKERPREP